MKTVTEQLADALRAVLPFAERDVGELLDLVRDDDSEAEADTASESIWAARNALAAYDVAQTNKGTVKSNRAWREECTLLRAALLQAQPQIRHLRQALERNGNVVAARDHRKTEEVITRALAGGGD